MALFPGLPRWAGTRKVKPIWNLGKQETASGSGKSWAICKSAPRSRQITTPTPHHSVFTGQMPFLSPNQQRQSTDGDIRHKRKKLIFKLISTTTSTDPWKFWGHSPGGMQCRGKLTRCRHCCDLSASWTHSLAWTKRPRDPKHNVTNSQSTHRHYI